jgi:hypothetical protein
MVRETRALIAERLRQVRLDDRVLYGSDGTTARFNPSTMLASYSSLPYRTPSFAPSPGTSPVHALTPPFRVW